VVGSAALLSVPFLLMTSGSQGKSTGRQVAVADVPQDTAPGSPAPSPSASSPSPSASASARHHASKPKADTSPSARPGSTATKHPPSKSPRRGGSPAATVAQLFGGASRVLLHNRATGLCADLPKFAQGSINGPVNQFHCHAGDSDNQMWKLQTVQDKGPGGARLFVISNIKDGLCMDLPDFGGKPAGTKVSEYRCDGSTRDNQTWYLAPGQDNHYQFRNSRSGGLCLGVAGGPGAGPDARLELRPCGPADTDWSW
jgi:hypothetical protein